MTILTYNNGPFKPAHYSLEKQNAARRNRAWIKQAGVRLLIFLFGGSLVAAIIAVKAAIYLSRFGYF